MTVFSGGFAEGGDVFGQALVDMAQEATHADVIEFVHMAVVALAQLFQLAVVPDLLEERFGRLQQAVVSAVGKSPGQWLWFGQIEGDAQFGIVTLTDLHFVRVGDDDGHFLLPELGEQIAGFEAGLGMPVDFRMFGDELFDQCRMPRARHDLAGDVVQIVRALDAAAINQLLRGFVIGRSEADLLHALGRDAQPGGGEMGFPARDHGQDGFGLFGDHELEFDAEVIGEHVHEVVFETGSALSVFVIGGGSSLGDDRQLAAADDLLQRRRRLAVAGDGKGCRNRENPMTSLKISLIFSAYDLPSGRGIYICRRRASARRSEVPKRSPAPTRNRLGVNTPRGSNPTLSATLPDTASHSIAASTHCRWSSLRVCRKSAGPRPGLAAIGRLAEAGRTVRFATLVAEP